MKNYYYILGIDESASTADIKKAFRKLSLKLHPDKNSDDPFFSNLFKDIHEAYECLIDENKRNDFDKSLKPIVNEKKVKQNIFGVQSIADIDFIIEDFKENFDYKFIVKIIDIENNNGNGTKEMMFYDSKMALSVFERNNWKLSPRVILSFNWTDVHATLTISDGFNTIKKIKILSNPASIYKRVYTTDVYRVLNAFISISNYVSFEEFMKQNSNTGIKIIQ